jgi:hypothetical protein
MATYVFQRKENFGRENLLKGDVECGVSISTTRKPPNRVFNYFGHSLFDAVATHNSAPLIEKVYINKFTKRT